MANYQLLKTDIDAKVYQNGKQEITGENLNSVLNAMVASLGVGYQFMGMATPTNPGTAHTPDYKCFYLATTPGTYTNLGGLVVADGEVALLKWDTSWTKEVTGAATASLVSQLDQKIYDFTIPNYVLGKYPMKAGHKYFFRNIGTAGDGSVYYRVTEDVSSVKIGDIPLGGTLEFNATEDSQFVSKSNISGFNIVVYSEDSFPGVWDQIDKNTNFIYDITKDLYYVTTAPFVSTPYKMIAGHTYIIKNTGTANGKIYYKVSTDSASVTIADLNVGQTAEFNATEDSLYLVTSGISGLQFSVCEKNSTADKLSGVIDNENVDADSIEALKKDLYGFIIPSYVLGEYPMKAGHKYFFRNIGTAGDGSVYYRVTEDVSSVKIGDIPLGGTLEFNATEDSQFVSKSNISGFNIVVYEDGSTYQKLQTNESREMPFIISACSYNLGDFSGDGLVTPSDSGSLEYRKMIGSIGANLIGTQEDVLYYGGESGMESGESVRDAIFGIYKNYYRRGQYQFNFKGFASDYPISDVYPVSYTDDVYNHPWFLRGILNGDILVVSLHFDWQDITRRRKQITQLISYCQSYDKVILMGDTNPSNRINGEPVDPAIPEIHAEDWAYFANAGYQMANGGLFGDLGTMFGDGQYAGQLFPYDNIFVKGGYVRDVKVVSAEWMNDHKPIVATIVF